MICPMCEIDLLWGGEHMYDEIGIEGEGIVGNYTCVNKKCEVEHVEIFTKL